jgi:hypothetical protein
MPNTDEYIGVVISDVARLLRTEFDRRVRRLGITRGQWLVLTRLHRHPGASHSQLAEMMEVEKATAGRMIDRLVANGWVERRSQPDDRRVNGFISRRKPSGSTNGSGASPKPPSKMPSQPFAQEGRQLMKLLQRVEDPGFRVDSAPRGRNRLPIGSPLRVAPAITTGRPRHDDAAAALGTGRRAGSRPARRADRLAAGWPLRLHRERVRQG